MSDQRSILFFTNSTLWGGVEGHICGLMRNLSRRMFRLHLACDPAIFDRFRAAVPGDVEVTPIELSHPGHVAGAMKLASLLRRERFAIVHSHMFWSSLFASPLARLCGVPVVVETLHGTEAWRKGWKASNLIDRATTGLVSRYVAVCESDARFLTEKKGVPAKKITVIHNGIETHRFHSLQGARSAIRNSIGATESDIVLIVVARLHSGKGHRVLLQALHLLTRIHPNLRLVCVGEGEEEAELKNLCHAFALESHVKWMGHQSNIPEWLAAADINVLPTHYEGLPLTILEAMAAGLPTVASAVGGIPDAIESGVSGLLVPPGEPGTLASALSTLIRSAATRARMADAARARVTLHFDLSQQVRNTENMYLELCRALSAPRAIRTPSPQSSEAEKAAIPATVD